ncbi:MAG: TIGR00296 family protein, partial [Planctomycetes bacterium]|nr:TIGR00296 family protein [Planctomycetota bacterium]
RGCIGRIVGDMPLYKTIIEYAVHAALRDPRFPPVTRSELPDLHIEISVMTPLERVTDVSDIQVGRDGLLIKVGYNQGLLLPQVAAEYGWDRDTFLAHTCRKAGLPLDAWKSPPAEIYRFSAQVFGEKE